jgi:hypothetical protein
VGSGSARLLAGPAQLGPFVGATLGHAGLPSPSQNGGLEEFHESLPTRRFSSVDRAYSVTIRRACSALAARNSAITTAWIATVASSSGSGEGIPTSNSGNTQKVTAATELLTDLFVDQVRVLLGGIRDIKISEAINPSPALRQLYENRMSVQLRIDAQTRTGAS